MSQREATVGWLSRRNFIAALVGGAAGAKSGKEEEEFVGGLVGPGATALALGDWTMYIAGSASDVTLNSLPALIWATDHDEWQAYGLQPNMSTQTEDGTFNAVTASTIEDASIDRPNTLVIALDTDEMAFFEEVPA